jgi:peptide/nickel transport system substrate-binding protein
MKTARWLILSSFALLTLVIMACGGGGERSQSGGSPGSGSSAAGKPVSGGTFTVAMAADVVTFDTTRISDVYSRMVVLQVAEPLFDIDKDGKTVGRLVESSDNSDPNVYVWKLRKGIKFTDGTDFDSEVVKFNIDRHRSEKSLRYADVKDIVSIETPDQYTVRITLKSPDRTFNNKFAPGAAGEILNPKAVAALGDNLQRDLKDAGTGPFKFVEWKKDTQVVLERNPNYWEKDKDGNQLPYLDRIVFKPIPDENARLINLKTGEVDTIVGNPPYKDLQDLKSNTELSLKEIVGLGFQVLEFNTKKEPFNNSALRRAVSYGIDRPQIRKTVFFDAGGVLDTPIPEGLTSWYQKDASFHPYLKPDAAKVKQELASGGKPNGFKFSLQLASGSPQLQQVAELIKDELKPFGIEMEIQTFDFAKIQANGRSGDFEALSVGWSGRVEPDGNFTALFYTGGASNYTGFSNPDFDKLIDDARKTADIEKAKAFYDQAVKTINEQQPMLVYYVSPQISLTRKNVQDYPQDVNGYWGSAGFKAVWKAR